MPGAVSIPMTELPPGQRRLVFIEGRTVAVFNIDGRVYAVDDRCPHQGASLANGKLEGTWLQCPAHGLRFDLAADDAAGLCLKHCTVSAANGALTVTLEAPPPAEYAAHGGLLITPSGGSQTAGRDAATPARSTFPA